MLETACFVILRRTQAKLKLVIMASHMMLFVALLTDWLIKDTYLSQTTFTLQLHWEKL